MLTESHLIAWQAVCGTTRFADGDYRGPHLVQDFLGILWPKPFDGFLLKSEHGHQMLPHLPKDLRVVSAADAPIILQNSLRQTGSTQFDITNDSEPR